MQPRQRVARFIQVAAVAVAAVEAILRADELDRGKTAGADH